MELLWDVLEIGMKILTLYTGLMGFLFFLPRKRFAQVAPVTRFAVVIPARNEENVIVALIESLNCQDYPAELFDIIVVPNNCTDDTEGVARRMGTKIVRCAGKGCGLEFTLAFKRSFRKLKKIVDK